METTGNPNPWPRASGLTALALFMIVGGLLFIGISLQPPAVAAPTAYTKFTAADGSFSCERPQNWDKRSGEAHAIQSAALFRRGHAEISIDCSLMQGLMGDFAQAPGGLPDLGAAQGVDLSQVPGMEKLQAELKKPAVEKVHESNRKLYSKLMADYDEKPAQVLRCAAGEGRVSEFTGKGGLLAGGIHGYRATILGPERGITVLAKCPERNWRTLKPAFERVLCSITPGN